MNIRKAWIHTYVNHDGERIPWKIAPSKDKMEALKTDDRIEEVSYFNDEELEEFKRSVTEITENYYRALLANRGKDEA